MKNAFKLTLALALTFGLMSLMLDAQTPPTPPPAKTQAFTEQDKAAAKEDLKKVGELFGIQKTEPATAKQAPAEKTESKPTTMPQVADKALDMIGNAVGSIASLVQKVAPEVWEIMVRQQYAAALGMLVGPFSFLFITAIYVAMAKRYWKKSENYDADNYFDGDMPSDKGFRALLTTLFPGIMAIIFSGVLAYRLGDAIPMLINPKYYAVKDLLQMLLNK
jgi:hypothetical protein